MRKLGFLVLLIIAVLFTSNVLAGSWSVQESGTTTNLFSVHFVDVNNGWVAGKDGLILHTSNGGITWTVQESKIDANLGGIYFIDKNNGWVGGMGGVQHTTDGGINWKIQNVRVMAMSVYFTDANKGWVVGLGSSGGIIFHTDNGGKTWGTQTIIGSTCFEFLNGVHFINSTYGWAVGEGWIILHTNDGGKIWATQTIGIDARLQDIYFSDLKNGWISGGSEIFHTNDGGITWETQITPEKIYGYRMHFIGSSTGWIAGEAGKILHTTNGGEVWNVQDSGTNKSLYGVCFIDQDNGWAVGRDGTILKYSELSPVRPLNVTVYPNPYRTEDKRVIFGYPTDPDKKLTGQSTIKIYNIAGEWIKTIEEINGDGRAIWDMTNNEGRKVASGVYVYCISNPEGQRCTGKIGVIK